MTATHSPLWFVAAGWLGRSSYMSTKYRPRPEKWGTGMVIAAALWCLYMGLR